MNTKHLPFLLVLAASPPQVQGEVSAEPPIAQTIEARLKAEEDGGLSGAVLLVRGGNVIHDGALGLANRERKIRCTPETLFDVGPAAVEFTRAGVLLLVQERLLALEDPVAKFFADVPEDKRAITIEHLLTARSGLPDGEPDPYADPGRDATVRRILSRRLVFEPGKGEGSSLAAWNVLAAVVEVVAGQPYDEFVRTSLLEPAGMKDTQFLRQDVPVERLAVGYPQRGPESSHLLRGPASWLMPGRGRVLSTTGDLWRWVQAVDQGKILATDLASRYFDAERHGLPAGAPTGFTITFRPDPDAMVILISNASAAGQHESLARELAVLLEQHEP